MGFVAVSLIGVRLDFGSRPGRRNTWLLDTAYATDEEDVCQRSRKSPTFNWWSWIAEAAADWWQNIMGFTLIRRFTGASCEGRLLFPSHDSRRDLGDRRLDKVPRKLLIAASLDWLM
jgi:hypothetical protein